jgi:hypothetical protein
LRNLKRVEEDMYLYGGWETSWIFSWLFLQNVFGRRVEKKVLGKCGMKDLGM